MFDIDFGKIHRYLVGRRVDPVTGLPQKQGETRDIPILNEEHPRSGIHICRETIFTSGSLAFICYARNVFEAHSDRVMGVKLCLKITAGVKKGRGDYGSARVQGETLSFECTPDDVVGIWRVLRGLLAEYSIYLPLAGEIPKSLVFKYQKHASSVHYASAEQGALKVGVSFQEGSSISFQSVIIALMRIHYPHLDSVAVTNLLDGHQMPTLSELGTEPHPSEKETMAGPAEQTSGLPVLRHEGEEDLKPGLRKAVYAICMQSWPSGRKDVAQYIQRHAGQRTAQRIVDEANGGDFSSLNDIAAHLDRS